MKETDFIKLIKKMLSNDFIGDDCAYLKDLNLTLTQDSLVEGVHFSLEYFKPYDLGYKSISVNISDILASGAEPKYLTVALSLPETVDEEFIKEFYEGAKEAAGAAQIVGGDITGADKIFISVCALGTLKNRRPSSRKNAKAGDKIVVCGNFGSSAAGLKLLKSGKTEPKEFIDAHLKPKLKAAFCAQCAQNAARLNKNYALTDSSDGLFQSILQICEESHTGASISLSAVPHLKSLETFSNLKDLILFGGEDYLPVAAVDEELYSSLDEGVVIGEITEHEGIWVDGEKIKENKSYKHFGEKI